MRLRITSYYLIKNMLKEPERKNSIAPADDCLKQGKELASSLLSTIFTLRSPCSAKTGSDTS